MNQPETMDVLERTLGLSDADAVAAAFTGATHLTTRFADSVITQNVRRSDCELSVSCAYQSRHASASTNDLSPEGLRALVSRAQAAARLSPPDPEYMPPLDAAERDRYPSVEAHFPRPDLLDPRPRAEAVARAARGIAEEAFRLSGAFGSADTVLAFANSAGLRAFHPGTHAELHATVLGGNGSGWAHAVSNDIAAIDPERVASEARRIAALAQNPVAIPPGKYTVVLRPAAVRQLLPHHMIADAKATDEGRTFLRGKLGQRVCGANITIRSDPSDPRCPGQPFQADGLASPTVVWVENGLLRHLAASRYWARKTGKPATGSPGNVIMEGGAAAEPDIIASTDRGLLVTRFWYIRFVDPMTCLLTGMTRDGLFLIEDGRIAAPVRNLRFNECVPEVLSRVDALGPVQRVDRALVPPIRVREFNFTSATDF